MFLVLGSYFKAGAEGLDFKNGRQIHIMEPWYNINGIEQIIGRGVRNSIIVICHSYEPLTVISLRQFN